MRLVIAGSSPPAEGDGHPFIIDVVSAIKPSGHLDYVISGNKAFIVYRIDADHAEWGTLT